MEPRINPYQSPLAVDADVPPIVPRGDAPWARPYASGRARAVWVTALLAMKIVLHAVAIAFILWCVLWVDQVVQRGEPPSHAEGLRLRNVAMVLSVPTILITLAALVALLMWTHRAYRNLPALDAQQLRYSPGWAVGYFFIPILHLFRPYQVMREIWRESDPARLPTSGESPGIRAASSALVGWWWAMWIALLIVAQISYFLEHVSTVEQIERWWITVWMSFFLNLLLIGEMILTILMVRRIDRNQTRRHELLFR
jgi:hypothetical protein